MKHVLLLFILTMLSISSHAKKPKKIDVTRIKCSYEYKHHHDTIKCDALRNDILYLEIGSKCSKCYSYYTHRVDSLKSTPQGSKKYTQEIIRFNGKYIRGKDEDNIDWVSALNAAPFTRLSTYVFKNYPEGKMTVFEEILTDKYVYEDSMDMQKWTLVEDSMKTIIGYECQQATCTFRGREWTVWFAPDIPIGEGPWKLCGLPGLIMEAYDKGKQQYFCINGLDQTISEPIYFGKLSTPIKEYEKTTYSKFLKAVYNELRNPTRVFQLMDEVGIPSGQNTNVPRRDYLERE